MQQSKVRGDASKHIITRLANIGVVKILPRLTGKDKVMKCNKHCQFKTRCWDQDGETTGAMKLAIEHKPGKGSLAIFGIGIDANAGYKSYGLIHSID